MYTHYDHGITCIDAGYIRPQMAGFYLLREGDEAVVIETGTNHSVPRLLALLKDTGLSREQLRYVIPTHVHLDHAGGAGRMMREFPQARLVVHPRGARHMIDPSQLVEGARGVFGDERLHQLYGEILPIDATRIIEAGDGFRLRIGQRELLFVDTPGHARHHFCIWDERCRGWFTGDCFGVAYPELTGTNGVFVFPTTTPVQFDAARLIETIERLAAYEPQWLYLTHFGRIAYEPRLRKALCEQIADYGRLGLEANQAGESISELASRLNSYTQLRLRDHGVTTAEAELSNFLALDMDLNAQGVLHSIG